DRTMPGADLTADQEVAGEPLPLARGAGRRAAQVGEEQRGLDPYHAGGAILGAGPLQLLALPNASHPAGHGHGAQRPGLWMIDGRIHGRLAPMSPFAAYHARGLAVAAAVLLLAPADAGAADYALSCEGTTITLACEDGMKAGTCRTAQASDPAWSVTCAGHD